MLHCRICNWYQDDYWHKDYYNPFRQDLIDSMKNSLFEDKIHCDKILSENVYGYAKKDGKDHYVIGKDYVVYELRHMAESIENMVVRTEEELKSLKIWRCPKCGAAGYKEDDVYIQGNKELNHILSYFNEHYHSYYGNEIIMSGDGTPHVLLDCNKIVIRLFMVDNMLYVQYCVRPEYNNIFKRIQKLIEANKENDYTHSFVYDISDPTTDPYGILCEIQKMVKILVV